MKNYIKPAISLQLLNTSTGVSDGCQMPSTSAEYACPVAVPGNEDITVFQEANGCSVTLQDWNEFCYQGPSGLVSVMGS